MNDIVGSGEDGDQLREKIKREQQLVLQLEMDLQVRFLGSEIFYN